MDTDNREEMRETIPPTGDNETEEAVSVEQKVKNEVKAEEIKLLLERPAIGTQNIYLESSRASQDKHKPLEEPSEDLPSLPPNLYPFRDPRHKTLLNELEDKRILLLTSYQEIAAYAAAFSLVHDNHFNRQVKKVFFPTRRREKDHVDFDLLTLAEEKFIGKAPQVLLIEIESPCTLLDSALTLGWGHIGKIFTELENHSSYMIFAINEDLLHDKAATARARNSLPYYTVSHLRYLLVRDLAERAEDLEKRLLATIERGGSPMDLRELHHRVADRLAEGVEAFENFLSELEEANSLPFAVRKERLQPIQPQDVFRRESEIHRAAAFIATYIPDLSQGDFDRLVLLLIGGKDGEQGEDNWPDRWRRNADRVFGDCYLRTIISGDGSWAVDFSEPYLRRELRGHIERHFPWYTRHQCQTLQDSGIFFNLGLSRKAVEGLVRFFVERAILDPTAFGSVWLLDLVRGLRIQLSVESPSASPEESLAWLLERLAIEAHLRSHFHSRLTLLIREMLDREVLRPMVREFFEFLISAKQHDALLDVILDLARRLRFAPHFEPLAWMRRLLDQGSEAVRERTAKRLVALARESGPRIYEFLSVIRSWLPEEGRSTERFSSSNRLALNFLFGLCLEIARLLPHERFGVWPSRHPLFYALPSDPAKAREEIGKIIEWLLDSRGAALENADLTETMRTQNAVRVGHVADLVEHWAWVLEGGSEDGPIEGRDLFRVVIEEIECRIGARERTWLQRSWQRRQDDYLRQAANGGSERAILVARRAKLDRLRMRFAALANNPGPVG